MTEYTAAAVVIIIVIVISLLVGVIRRIRYRARLSSARADRAGGRLVAAPKPWGVQTPGGYSTYNRATPSAPPPAHTPQYHPRGYDTYPGHPQGQRVPPSSIRTIPNQRTPGSPVPTRPPSGVTSRPISLVDPRRTSMHRNESAILSPSSPSSPSRVSSPRSAQRDLASPPSSRLPQGPSAVTPTASPALTHPSAATAQPNALPPSSLASMPTGASYNIDDPPPAYTPV